MTIRYVKSGATGAANGTSWADAYLTLGAALSAATAGDTIYVSHQHDQVSSAELTLTFPSSTTTYTRVICVNDGAAPPTTLATTAKVRTSGTYSINIAGGAAYVYGVQFTAGESSTGAPTISCVYAAGQTARLEQCRLEIAATGSGGRVYSAGALYDAFAELIDCEFVFGNTSQRIGVGGRGGHSRIRGGSVATALTGPVFEQTTNMSMLEVDGLDLSAIAASANLLSGGAFRAVLRNCKLPASWSGSLSASAASLITDAEMHATDNAGAITRQARQSIAGSLVSETTLVRDGGSDVSWKIVTTASADLYRQFTTPEIARWNDTTGVPVDVSVEILRDSATDLTDADIWLEVLYYSESGSPLGAWASGRAGLLATGTDHANSAASWTTTGMTNPNPQTLSVTFTPQLAGYVQARVCVAKASTTVYVDPQIELT